MAQEAKLRFVYFSQFQSNTLIHSDYLFLWSYSLGKSKYYIQLEDDIIAKPDFLTFIDKSITNEPRGWFMLEFSNLGFIGKCFRDADLRVSYFDLELFLKLKLCCRDWQTS